jgi:DNA-binding transcriptional regulator GbsR (MarR family)
MQFSEREPPSYKSFKAEKFNKVIERTKGLITSVNESSLSDEDKRKLFFKMKEQIELTLLNT